MKSILFICTGNTCRSPFAACYFQYLLDRSDLKSEYIAESAGIYAADREHASEYMQRAAQEYGLSLDLHRACRLTTELADHADIILCMETTHKKAAKRITANGEKIFTLNEYVSISPEDIPDPFGKDLDDYKQSAAKIAFSCDALIRKLTGKE